MADADKSASGVQKLISKIRDDGVQAASKEADQLLADAKRKAAKIIEDARTEAKSLRAKAKADIEAEKTAARGALELASRDARLELQDAVLASFERWVKRLVSDFTSDRENMRALVLVLAGHAVEEFVKDRNRQILANEVLFQEAGENPILMQRARQSVLGITADMLREGVELIPDSEIEGGAKVRLVDEKLELDLTIETIHKLLLKHMLPRFRGILEDQE